jgi:hypothetical protein
MTARRRPETNENIFFVFFAYFAVYFHGGQETREKANFGHTSSNIGLRRANICFTPVKNTRRWLNSAWLW